MSTNVEFARISRRRCLCLVRAESKQSRPPRVTQQLMWRLRDAALQGNQETCNSNEEVERSRGAEVPGRQEVEVEVADTTEAEANVGLLVGGGGRETRAEGDDGLRGSRV